MTILTSEALASALDAVNNAVIHHAQQHQHDGTPAHPIEVAILLSVFANSVSQQLRQDAETTPGYVPIPTNPTMAAGMALIGERWLRDNAPERISDLDCPSCGGSGHKGDNLNLATAPLGTLTTIGDVMHRKVENGWLIATSHRDLDRAPTHRLPLKVTDEMAKVMDGYCSDNSVGGLWAGEPQELWDRAVQAWWKSAPDMHPDLVQYNVGDFTMEMVFKPTGMTNLSDMQAVLDQVEVSLQNLAHPPVMSVSITHGALRSALRAEAERAPGSYSDAMLVLADDVSDERMLRIVSGIDFVINNGEPAVFDGEDFAPLVNITADVSKEPVPSHGGPSRGITWSISVSGVVLASKYERYSWHRAVADCEPPGEFVELAQRLKPALAALPRGKRE